MKKRIIALVLSALLLLSLVACAQKTEIPANEQGQQSNAPAASNEKESESVEQVEITFWHSYSEGEEKIFTDTVLAAFETAHPEIKVNAIRMPYEGL